MKLPPIFSCNHLVKLIQSKSPFQTADFRCESFTGNPGQTSFSAYVFFADPTAILRIPSHQTKPMGRNRGNPFALALFFLQNFRVFLVFFSGEKKLIEGTTSIREYGGKKTHPPGSPFLDWKLGRWWFSPPTFEIMVFHSEFPTFLKNGGRSWTSRRYMFPILMHGLSSMEK